MNRDFKTDSHRKIGIKLEILKNGKNKWCLMPDLNLQPQDVKTLVLALQTIRPPNCLVPYVQFRDTLLS